MRKARFSREQVTDILQKADRDPVAQNPAHAVQFARRAKTKWLAFIEESKPFDFHHRRETGLLLQQIR